MEHEALLRLEALERASSAEKAEEEGREVRALAKLEAESLRAQVKTLFFTYPSRMKHFFFSTSRDSRIA